MGPAIELELIRNLPSFVIFAKSLGHPRWVPSCIFACFQNSEARLIEDRFPDVPPSASIGEEFVAAMAGRDFFCGEQPGPIDLSYFGTLLVLDHLRCPAFDNHMQSVRGLLGWWNRMK